jgi:spore coat protein H
MGMLLALQASCGSTTPAGQTVTNDNAATNDNESANAGDSDNARPAGWTDATHGKNATPDYAVVFPQGTVRRIDITISPSDWQAMLDDMTNSNGEFGQGGGVTPGGGATSNGVPSPDTLAACADRQEGDACTLTFNGTTTEGSCAAAADGQLSCRAPMGPNGPGGGGMNSNGMLPPDMLTVCASLQEGDACAVSFNGTTVEGTCTALGVGQLVCQPPMGPGGLPNGMNSNGAASPEMVAACATLQEGDACTVSFNGAATEGTCAVTGDGQLACDVQMGPGGGGMPNGGGMLGNDDTNPLEVPCTLVFEDQTWWYVGIRFKGFSSLSSTWSSGSYKLPFRLDFDEFEDEHPEIEDQRFFGFKELSLASNWSDRTYLREKVTHDIFREAGVPAPRTAFYRLYIDFGEGSQYFGLYAMTEIPDKPMLESQFGDDGGNLYKPTSTWASFNEDDFDKQTNKNAADWSDVQAAIAALHADRSDAAAWRAGLEAVFNVEGFLRWLAVNTVIVNWDTYGQMAHNYYLYGNPDDAGRLNWIPWDNNMAFMAGMGGGMGGGAGGGDGGLSLGLTEVGEQWPLIRYLLDDAVYHAAYVAEVQAFVEGTFDVAAIQARFQAEHDLIAPYVTGAEGEQTGYTLLTDPQEFETALDDLLQFVAERSAAALEFLGATE